MLNSKQFNNFMKKVNKTESCWEWTGSKDRYGFFGVNGKIKKAHRVSYEHFKGPISPGLLVRHKCDNPSCVNPDHLYLTTKSETRSNFYLLRINQEMIFQESIRYLEKLIKLRPDLKVPITELIEQIKDPKNIHRINIDNHS